MSEPSRPIHGDHPSLAPALGVRDAETALAWYREVFGAREVLRLTAPDGTLIHGEIVIGGSLVMVGEESPDQGNTAPPSLGGTPVRLHLYVDDAEALAARAVERGADLLIPVERRFYGDVAGRFRDPFGHVWIVATRVEEVPPEEMQARLDELFEE